MSSEKVTPAFTLVYKLFGPIYPGSMEENKLYTLKYPGISFIFPIPDSFLPLQKGELPFLSKDNTTPILKEVQIYRGNDPDEVIEETEDDWFEPVLIHAQSIEFVKRQSIIKLMDTPQDVLCELGPPNDQMQKETDKMEIHRSDKSADVSKPPDYIWNYFSHGIDFVFDGSQHRVIKIILHSNFLGHLEMLRYAKCNFSFADKKLDHKSTWKRVNHVMGDALGPPVVYNKEENPFGPTLYYGYEGVLFEVMKNDYVASVTLFAF
jgi:hypothetical protein